MSNNKDHNAIQLIIQTLSIGVALNVKKSWFGFGRPSPGDRQIGWIFGFVDAVTQQMGKNDIEALAIITTVFESLFPSDGSRYVGQVTNNQASYFKYLQEGGSAYLDWCKNKVKPIVPPE